MAPKIAPETVLKIAGLARLSLEAAEVERLSNELSTFLGYFEKINRLDTSSVPATSHTLDAINAPREDKTSASLAVEDAIAATAHARENLFLVPPIKEEEGSL